jgi:hypothetical protein
VGIIKPCKHNANIPLPTNVLPQHSIIKAQPDKSAGLSYLAEVKKFKIVNLVEQITYEESFLLLSLHL